MEAKTTRDLKRVLGFGDLMSASIGQIIGAGIMSLMGVAIAMTGRSAVLSFVLAAVFVILTSLPALFINGTIRMRGGGYTQAGLLGNSTLAGITMFLNFFSNVSLAMYALSFADYFLRFVPNVSGRLIAAIVMTIFYLLNMFGIDKFAKVQKWIVGVMCVALALFAAFGVSKVQPGFFEEGFMTGGFIGLLRAAALLTFATGGATIIVNLSGEAKNPTRDIPTVIIISTITVAVLYAVLAFVAAGVLPVQQVAGKPLTQVAEAILPKPLFIFFIVGGAMFALVSTLNTQFASSTKPMLQASVDGWLPKQLAYIHPRFKTPMIWLTIFYVLGLIPIVTGLDIAQVANMTLIIFNINALFLNALLIRLPRIVPAAWDKSKFKVCRGKLYLIAVSSILFGALTITLMITGSSPFILICNALMLLVSVVYSIVRERSGKVHMEVSYEEQ